MIGPIELAPLERRDLDKSNNVALGREKTKSSTLPSEICGKSLLRGQKSQVFQIFFRVLAILKVMIQPFINVVESSEVVLFLLAKTFGSIVKLYTLESDAK